VAATNANRRARDEHPTRLIDTNPTGIAVTVFLERGQEPISGWIEVAAGQRLHFAGWLDLAAVLTEANEGAEQGPRHDETKPQRRHTPDSPQPNRQCRARPKGGQNE
jgi:hypothetical protein